MRHIAPLLALLYLIMYAGCAGKPADERFIQQAWKLTSIEHSQSDIEDYSQSNIIWLRIYDDSCFYSCQLVSSETGLVVVPTGTETYYFSPKKGGQPVYLQGEDRYRLTIENDSTIAIEILGSKYKWTHCHELDAERTEEVVDLLRSVANDSDAVAQHYVFSHAERRLETTNHALGYAILAIASLLVVIAQYTFNLRRNKRRVEAQLRQIEEERETMPAPVREALVTIEEDFRQSAFYADLHRRIAAGERLSAEDWAEIEELFKRVYPRFIPTLLSLRSMSETEMQVCQLLKLDVSPTEIASVLCKNTSTISTIRSRLYQKVFDRKGGSKDWDEFIRSL